MNGPILITGANGFLGSHVVERFLEGGCAKSDLICPRRTEYDLTKPEDVQRMYSVHNPAQVVHVAADIGGIGYSKANPGSQFYNNILMNTFVLDGAFRAGVDKFVGVGTVCSYPKFTPIPFQEKNLWNGYPEETNAAYGLSKKMLLVQSHAYRQQYGFNAVHLLMINLYGPRDDFDPESSHVIPALIRKIEQAMANDDQEIEMWGDGSPTREFLFVTDAAEAIFLAARDYDKPDPVNIGNGTEISIKSLVDLTRRIMGYAGDVIWNESMPNGQPRRRLDVSKAKNEFGFTAEVDLPLGLKKTVEWYRGLGPSAK